MNRLVALKVLSKEIAGTERFAQRFQREVETIAKLSHPNIVMAFDADEGPAGPFLVMEYVKGCDLASEVHTRGPLAVDDAVDCILQSAQGLVYAHAQGIIHRDIKPGNILRDASGILKVADLGLARLNSTHGNVTSLTQAGGVLGTVDFMAPEQAVDSTTIDGGADIYSLGCTLYLLLTGHPPFTGNSIMSVLLKHRDAPIPPLAAARPDVPPALDAIYQTMVAKKREARFGTMTDVVRALEELKRTTHLSDARPSMAGACSLGMTVDFGDLGATGGEETRAGNDLVQPAQEVAAGLAGRTVVIVEPSRTQAGFIRRYLDQLKINVAKAVTSGQEALAAAKECRADAIISAMHLADMTGVQLAKVLAADPACADIGFILATSETDGNPIAELPTARAVVVLSKPFDVTSLTRAVAQAISHRAVTCD